MLSPGRAFEVKDGQEQDVMMHHRRAAWQATGVALTAGVFAIGCEMDSFFDQSVVGRWEGTPVTLPILESLDVIESDQTSVIPVTEIRADDLIPDVREYTVGPSDLLLVSIFELLVPGQDAVYQRRVDETGRIRLPQVGVVDVTGLSSSQLETRIGEILEQKGILRDPTVSVVLAEARGNTFSILAAPETDGTRTGTYQIPQPDFRLLDAITLAGGISERTQTLTIYRQVPLDPRVAGEVPETPLPQDENAAPPAPSPEDPAQLIEDVLEGNNAGGTTTTPTQPSPAPAGVERGLDESPSRTQWVNVDGKWIRVDQQGSVGQTATGTGSAGGTATTGAPGLAPSAEGLTAADAEQFNALITQRLIEVPYERLVNGDMRYNIVIRPGDIIRIPDRNAGFVYVMGAINRPGAYTVPGQNELNVKQLIASAGGLGGLAVPERVDLTRRIDGNHEATVRLDVRAIFEGTQPDIFLKPNDQLNFGTSWWATPLAIIRNGFRASYGFGFILDRNFADDVFRGDVFPNINIGDNDG